MAIYHDFMLIDCISAPVTVSAPYVSDWDVAPESEAQRTEDSSAVISELYY